MNHLRRRPQILLLLGVAAGGMVWMTLPPEEWSGTGQRISWNNQESSIETRQPSTPRPDVGIAVSPGASGPTAPAVMELASGDRTIWDALQAVTRFDKAKARDALANALEQHREALSQEERELILQRAFEDSPEGQ